MESTYAIETRDLSFSFSGSGNTVDHVDLKVPMGSIYGFLGPNGAGKTTTMKLLCGMLPAGGENIYLLGQQLSSSMPSVFSEIGTLIETPSLYLNLDATDNLRVICSLRGWGEDRIPAVLDMVGLGTTGKKKVKAFSLGMKQRLGIAMALLHKPKLLLLDEPVNGLDPAGIVEIRELLLRLQREQGITIFISSHLLSEIEKTCDHIGIIHKGRMRYQGSMQELLGRPDLSREVLFHVPGAGSAAEKLRPVFPGIQAVQDNRLLLVLDEQQQVSAVTRTMVEMGVDIEGIDVKKGLEDWFMNITTQKA